MKKLFFYLSLLLLYGAIFVSCADTKPNLKFNLTITADIQEPNANIWVYSVSTVTNDRFAYFPSSDETVRLSVTEQLPETNEWLENYIEKNLIAKLPDKTLYLINVVGWVKETNTGVLIHVDKTFSNEGIKSGKYNCKKLID